MRDAIVVSAVVTALAPWAGAGVGGQEVEGRSPEPSPFVGQWAGAIEVPGAGVTLRLRFHVEEADGGGLQAVMISVDQGNARVPVQTVEADGRDLAMAIPAIAVSFEGVLSEDGATIEGTFTQAGQALPLVLEQSTEAEAEEAARRPQDPEEPFPYHAEDVSYPNSGEGHSLAGTFTRPTGDGPFPAVLLISGSGPQDRNEALLGHRPFLVLSDHLTRSGLAVLRFDDRGVGESGGDFASATSADFASDALAGVAYLKTRADVDAGKIGLAGHSEGGLIAPMAAVRSSDVAFIVLMAGPGVAGERILYAQGALIARAAGASEEAIANNMERQRAIFDVVRSEPDTAEAARRIEALVLAQLEEATEEERSQAGVDEDASLEQVASTQAAQVNSPWFRYFLFHDPAPVLEQVSVPVLAVNGEKDLQVPYEENLREIEAALQRGGNARYEVHALPDHNHLFQRAETGAPSEYQEIEETWSVESMELIAQWILKTVAGSTTPPEAPPPSKPAPRDK